MPSLVKLPIRVFKEFQPYLRLLTAYKTEHFHSKHDYRRIISSIVFALFPTVLGLSNSLLVVLTYWDCIDAGLQAHKLSFALPITITSIQIISTQIALTWKNQLLNDTIEFLQCAVNESEFLLGLFRFYNE